MYERRRADARMDRLEAKLDAISRLVYLGLGMVMLLTFVMNLIGPLIISAILKGQAV